MLFMLLAHLLLVCVSVTISGIDLKTIEGRDVIVIEDIIDTGEKEGRHALFAFLESSVSWSKRTQVDI